MWNTIAKQVNIPNSSARLYFKLSPTMDGSHELSTSLVAAEIESNISK